MVSLLKKKKLRLRAVQQLRVTLVVRGSARSVGSRAPTGNCPSIGGGGPSQRDGGPGLEWDGEMLP